MTDAIHVASGWTDGALLGLSWISTYLLHSSLLLGAVWAAQRLWRGMPDGLQESLWKAALLGGLLTTTWQVGFDAMPYGGTVHLQRPAAAIELLAAEPRPGLDAPPPLGELAPPGDPRAHAPDTTVASQRAFSLPPTATAPTSAAPEAALDWAALALLLYGACVALGLVHLVVGRLRFHHQLADRELIVDGELPLQLLRLVERAGFGRAVRLTHSDRVNTPIAFGSLQPEICVPSRAIEDLQRDELESLLAHELAHLLHRDPAWLLACQVLERTLFIQPLHRLARRHLLHLAEYRCDAWAARHACSGTSLARCLVEVARWIVPAQPRPVHAAGMAGSRSLLWQRVGRILENPGTAPRPAVARLVSVAMLALGAAALPAASWTSTIATSATPPDLTDLTEVTEMTELEAGPGLVALSEELDLLHTELRSLRAALADRSPDPETEALVRQLEQYAEGLRQRRELMQAMLPATQKALRAGAQGGSSSVSSDVERRRP